MAFTRGLVVFKSQHATYHLREGARKTGGNHHLTSEAGVSLLVVQQARYDHCRHDHNAHGKQPGCDIPELCGVHSVLNLKAKQAYSHFTHYRSSGLVIVENMIKYRDTITKHCEMKVHLF